MKPRVQETTIEEVTYLFAPNEEHRPVILLGAGASFSSGIPLAGRMVHEIAKWAYARRMRNTTPDRIQIRRSEWENFLKGQSWYDAATALPELYPHAVKELLVPSEFRRSFFQKVISDHPTPSAGYVALARLCKRHLVSHFFTTNFDPLLENSLRAEAPHIREVTTVNKTPLDFEAFSPNRKAQVVYLHGSVENYSDKNLPNEVLNLDANLLRRIHSLIEYSPIVLVGYRGAELSIMNDLFEKGLEVSGNYRRGIYWCMRGTEEPHDNVLRLHEKIGNNLRLVRIEGFDELFVEVDRRLEGESLNPQLPSRDISAAPASSSPDSQPYTNASFDDLDKTLLEAGIEEHCRRINNSEIKDFEAHLLEYDFASRIDGRIVPHFGLWLLFGNNVTQELPHLKSILRIGDKEERVIEGNLISQFNEIRQFLASEEMNPPLRIKKSGAAEEKNAYHPRALLELLVNHFVHRDYFIEEPCEIVIQPGTAVIFKTIGGLPAKVLHQLSPDEKGKFTPRRGVREQRNALLADVFYGMRVMDREGSGLVDVQKFALEHEGGTDFRIAPRNSGVISTLYQAMADPAGRGRTARARPEKLRFVANLFQIRQLPPVLYAIPLKNLYASKPKELHLSGVAFDDIPPIRTYAGQLIGFESFQPFSSETDKAAETAKETTFEMAAWLADPDKRRVVVALLRKYWERFLAGFTADGLVVDRLRRRAYFIPDENGAREITYDAPSRKGESRGVVKDRETYKENEGIAYSVEQFGGLWAIQIKPIYVFTDASGTKALPGMYQTKRATKRYKFDRNIQVVQDLNFWTCYLMRKKPIIDLANSQEVNLFLEGNLLDVEATEISQ